MNRGCLTMAMFYFSSFDSGWLPMIILPIIENAQSFYTDLPLLQFTVLLSQVQQLLTGALHLGLQLLELRQVHLCAGSLNYIIGGVLN